MPGPAPKDPATRARRNKASTRRRLEAVDSQFIDAPPSLPDLRSDDRAWRDETRAWWTRVWASPMAEQILEGEVDQLLVLAYLMDDFFREPGTSLAGEIRQQRQAFGLTPLDRRRLEWEIDRVEGAKHKPPGKEAAPGKRRKDPRDVLRAVK